MQSGREGSQASTLPSDLEKEVRLNTDRRRKKRKSLRGLQEQRQLLVTIAALLKISLEKHVYLKYISIKKKLFVSNNLSKQEKKNMICWLYLPTRIIIMTVLNKHSN